MSYSRDHRLAQAEYIEIGDRCLVFPQLTSGLNNQDKKEILYLVESFLPLNINIIHILIINKNGIYICMHACLAKISEN